MKRKTYKDWLIKKFLEKKTLREKADFLEKILSSVKINSAKSKKYSRIAYQGFVALEACKDRLKTDMLYDELIQLEEQQAKLRGE